MTDHTPEELPDLNVIDTIAMEGVCPETHRGWLWYCDEHDNHGTGDTEAEVRTIADAHSDWHIDQGAESACDVITWQRTTSERIS